MVDSVDHHGRVAGEDDEDLLLVAARLVVLGDRLPRRQLHDVHPDHCRPSDFRAKAHFGNGRSKSSMRTIGIHSSRFLPLRPPIGSRVHADILGHPIEVVEQAITWTSSWIASSSQPCARSVSMLAAPTLP